MPLYNGQKYLARALDSILAQTFADFELILADDASGDETPRICADYCHKDTRIRYIRHQDNLGMNANFNFVVEQARGKYFLWAAQDDQWSPDFLEKTAAELNRDTEVGIVGCGLSRQFENGSPPEDHVFSGNDSPNQLTYLQLAQRMATAATRYHLLLYGLYRMQVLRQALAVEIPEVASFDRLFMCQIALGTKMRYVPEVLFHKTVHAEPLAVRYAGKDERWVDAFHHGHFAFTETWLALEPYLWQSTLIPAHRKPLAALLATRFAESFSNSLYMRDLPVHKQAATAQDYSAETLEDLKAATRLGGMGHHDQAHQLASALVLMYPQSQELLLLLASAKINSGHLKPAAKLLQRLLEDSPGNGTISLQLARAFWGLRQQAQAIQLVEEILRAEPNNLGALAQLAQMNIELGELDAAATLIRRALALQPDNKELQRLLSSIEQRRNALDQIEPNS